ncbi:MAG: hypothetical protein RLZ64_1904 [Pseudomonadota bacterium]
MNFFTELCACLNIFSIYLDATRHAVGSTYRRTHASPENSIKVVIVGHVCAAATRIFVQAQW